MAEPKYFKTIYVLSDIWQSAGYGSIVYMAALTGIDPSLYEAATVDGASKWDKLIHITLPGLLPTIIIMLILRMGSIFSVGYEKIMLMYNPGCGPVQFCDQFYHYHAVQQVQQKDQ